MKVVKAETPNDLKGILNFSDDSENYLSCTRMEWVQWLVQQVGLKNDKLGVWVVRGDDQRMMGYWVAVDSILPPLFFSVTVLYMCLPFQEDKSEMMRQLEEWAKERGAQRIDINTRAPRLFSKPPYEFHDTRYTIMFKEIKEV